VLENIKMSKTGLPQGAYNIVAINFMFAELSG
jgi:hypothetical protein